MILVYDHKVQKTSNTLEIAFVLGINDEILCHAI